jgi:hypothetical protein
MPVFFARIFGLVPRYNRGLTWREKSSVRCHLALLPVAQAA